MEEGIVLLIQHSAFRLQHSVRLALRFPFQHWNPPPLPALIALCMFIPLRTDASLRTTPYMNWALIVANVLIWVAQEVFSRNVSEGELSWYYRYMLNAGAPEVWTFITYGFLHANAMHIIG